MNGIDGTGRAAMNSVPVRRTCRSQSTLPWLAAFALFGIVACSSSKPSGGSASGNTTAGSGSVSSGGSGSVSSGSISSGSLAGSGSISTGSSGSVSSGSTTGTSADASSNDVGTTDVSIDVGTTDASIDVGTTDATSEAATATGDSGDLGPSCIKALYSTYVLRGDGVLIWENSTTSPQTILDASTGLPLTGILNVQEGNSHGCAALSSGAADCWQTNASNGNIVGQLGNGTTMADSVLYRATPVLTAAATPLTNVVAVASGLSSTACAVTGDGKLWCWGDLTWIVNKGTAALYSGYAQAITSDGMSALTGVSQAVLGDESACAIVAGSTNTVWCWGDNENGQLGQGDTSARQYPTKVLGLTNPTKLAISGNTSYVNRSTVCALDGLNVRCWGDNANGSTGTNTTTNPVQSPTLVVTQGGTVLGGVTDLQTGNYDFVVLRTDETIWTWGYGFTNYAANYGLTNVLAIGWAGPPGLYNGPRYLTSDGIYHNAMTNLMVNCNAM
jgi:regulator of chromosome condensation (RCC1) repeat-containing protein/Regulator of Chromosome Condensation (RCC1) repeat protein